MSKIAENLRSQLYEKLETPIPGRTIKFHGTRRLASGNWRITAHICRPKTESMPEADFYDESYKAEFTVVVEATPAGDFVRFLQKQSH